MQKMTTLMQACQIATKEMSIPNSSSRYLSLETSILMIFHKLEKIAESMLRTTFAWFAMLKLQSLRIYRQLRQRVFLHA